ncbi:hypothetical protein [Microcystis aeruginosa]|nr:hypothetical protein [Microcystis aeruginosa]
MLYIVDPYVLPQQAEEYYREKIYRLLEIYLGFAEKVFPRDRV